MRRSTSSTPATFGSHCGGRALELELDPPPLRRASERVHVPGGDDPPVVDDRDLLADVLDELELMAGEEDGRAARRLAAENLGERLDRDRVEPGERLVEDEQLRLVQQRGGELRALLVAVRELLDLRVRAIREAEPLEPARCGDARRCVVEPVQAAEVGELLADRHARVEATLLRHVAEPQPLRQPDRLPVPEHLAAVELDEPEDRAHRGRLAGTVRPEEAEHPPALDRERAAVEGLYLAEPLGYVEDG